MSAKPGRNEPCPCGSGKKFKKCCGRDSGDFPEFRIPDDQRTGTPLDDYMELFPLLTLHEQKIIQFEPDGGELKKARQNYEKRYRPGEDDGLMDSHYISWLYFDLRFGGSRKTIVERVLDDPMTHKLFEPGPTCLRQMAASYATFYEVVDGGPEVVRLEELGTGRPWSVFHFRELFGAPPGKGEIWYTRLIGSPERSLCYTTPYVYDPEARAQFQRGVTGHLEDFLKTPASIGVPAERVFAESQKQSTLFWAEYIRVSKSAPAEQLSSVPSEWPARPPYHIVNTDRQELVITEMHFRVKDEAAVRDRLAKLKTFVHNETDDSWSWLKSPSRKFPDEPRTSLGRFRFKDGALVAETNSRERAAGLEWKLVGFFRGLLKLEKTLYRELEDLPRPSPEEIEKRRKEDEELNARPEVQEAMRQYLEHHYLDRWPREKIPALGNVTPLQAAKTEAGRKRLADLIDHCERTQGRGRSGQPSFDFDRLRLKMGLPAKRH